MKTKYLSAILVTGAMVLGAAPAMAESSEAPELNFSCQVVDGVPTTLAQAAGNEVIMPVFHWKHEALAPHSFDTPKQLCDRATAKLKDYSAQGYDLSKISFIGAAQSGLPSICASTKSGDCSKVLLTLSSTEKPDVVAKDIVDAIIAKDLKQFKQEGFNDRGLQSTSYPINFLSLMGLKFFNK